ncbi:hypothetical protein WCLP8_3080007 [uncultured Gammaproteobacteria bacterium]
MTTSRMGGIHRQPRLPQVTPKTKPHQTILPMMAAVAIRLPVQDQMINEQQPNNQIEKEGGINPGPPCLSYSRL